MHIHKSKFILVILNLFTLFSSSLTLPRFVNMHQRAPFTLLYVEFIPRLGTCFYFRLFHLRWVSHVYFIISSQRGLNQVFGMTEESEDKIFGKVKK